MGRGADGWSERVICVAGSRNGPDQYVERWSNKEVVEEGVAFTACGTGISPEVWDSKHTERTLEDAKMWLETRRRSGQ